MPPPRRERAQSRAESSDSVCDGRPRSDVSMSAPTHLDTADSGDGLEIMEDNILHDQHILTEGINSCTTVVLETDAPASVNEHRNDRNIINNKTANLHRLPSRSEGDKRENCSKSKKKPALVLEKQTKHMNDLKSKHPICLNICNNCSNNCNEKFSKDERRTIWNDYWSLSYSARREWLASCVTSKPIKRRRVYNAEGSKGYRKNETRIYVLPKDKTKEKVCLSFFLKTLGYSSDSVITELRKACQKGTGQVKDNRGRKKNSIKCNYSLVVSHIKSFSPHNAPHMRYMPGGVTLKYLYSDFSAKHPGTCSKETYRKTLIEQGILLLAPESDICADCYYYDKLKKLAKCE